VSGDDLESVCFCGNYILRFLIPSIKMSDIIRKKFYDVLSESVNNKKDNNCYQPIYFVTQNVTTLKLGVTSDFVI
jgi:hypothetical protein